MTLMEKPEPLYCGNCGKPADWVPDPKDEKFPWDLEGEWWIGPMNPREDLMDYTCSRRCYLARLAQLEK